MEKLVCEILKDLNINEEVISKYTSGEILKSESSSMGSLITTLTNKDKTVIEKLKVNELTPFHVIKSQYLIGGDIVEMSSYLVIPNEDLKEKMDYSDGYFYSFVINHTWDIEEYGYVVVESKKGILNRKY